MVLKRQISIQSKIEPPAKHVKPVPKEDLNEHEKEEKIKELTDKVAELQSLLVKKCNEIATHKKVIVDNQNIVGELLEKNDKLEQDMVEMLSTNQDLENEMTAKTHELEAQVTDLKKQMEPDDEIEQLSILMAGKNKSYSKAVTGTIPKKKNSNKVCEVCQLVCETERKYLNHIKGHDKDDDWNCKKCDFQTNSIHKASKQALEAHVCKTKPDINNTECTVCKDTFPNKTDLNKHKLTAHKSWKLCTKFFSNNPNIKCQYNPCHYSHVAPTDNMQRCYDCGREFMTTEELMLHRKLIHKSICRLFQTNACERDQESCWFNHYVTKRNESAQNVRNSKTFSAKPVQNVATENNIQDFQNAPQTEAPNLFSQEISKMMDHMMKTLKGDMTQMFHSMMNHRQN